MDIASTDFRHKTPGELCAVLEADEPLNTKWNELTPLARNEWICWLTSPRKPETRAAHLVRLQEEVLDGKRRPCCWPGCPHRQESARKYLKD